MQLAPTQQLACNGAPGVPKPGTAPIVSFSIGAVSAILSGLTDGVAAIAISVLFAGLSFDAGAFCGDGDVGDPGMTVDDWANALDYANPAVNIPAAQKAQQWFKHVIYPILCDCSDGSSPLPNTPTAPPALDTSPNTPPATLGPNCWNNTAQRAVNYANHQAWNFNDILPNIPGTHTDGEFTARGLMSPTPNGLVVSFANGNEGATPWTVQGIVNFYNVSNNGTGSFITPFIGPGTSYTSNLIAIPANTTQWQIIATATSGTGTSPSENVTCTATVYCQGQSPTAVNTPCCPPDPSMDLRLAAIQQMLQELLSLQALAGAYQDTVHHNELSGEGVLTINPASSAIRIDVVSDLTNWPKHPQTPTYYLSLGFITPFAVGTPLRGQRLIYNHQTFTWPSYTDQIGYTIAAGLVVNIVELTRGA